MTENASPLDGYPHDEAGEPADPPVAPTPRQVAMGKRADARMLTVGDPLAGTPTRQAPGDLVAPAVVQLVTEANEANPGRDKSSDGTWGDARHQALGSGTDHNAWLRHNGHGYVRAGDLDVDGLDLVAAVERARAGAAAGSLPQLVGGGYVIFNGRITAPDFSHWRVYTGADPHVRAAHFSVSTVPARFLLRDRWDIFAPAPTPAPAPPSPPPAGGGWPGPDAIGRGPSFRADDGTAGAQSNGPRVAELQSFLRRYAPAYAGHLAVDGWYGPQTGGVVREFAQRSRITAADGRNVGPQIALALWRVGFDR